MPQLPNLAAADRAALAKRGISETEARRQLALLAEPPAPPTLLRACGLGDGILRLEGEPLESAEAAWQAWHERPESSLLKLVPASGAATRMFGFLASPITSLAGRPAADIDRLAASGDVNATALARLVAGLRRLPVRAELERVAAARGLDWDTALETDPTQLVVLIAATNGLDLGALPKGLLPFHEYPDEIRTAWVEHCHEAAEYAAGSGPLRLHLTVGADHLSLFEAALAGHQPEIERATGRKLQVTYSLQDPATDTLALDRDGRPLRDAGGRLLLRPAGHGALIANLAALDAEIVCIKNIDNIARRKRHTLTGLWKRRLVGHLLVLRNRSQELLEALAEERTGGRDILDRAADFLETSLAVGLPQGFRNRDSDRRRRELIDRLDRPLRVCGVVRNQGEPGGGPFWLGSEEGVASGQIVEASQVDRTDARQDALFREATHFNPVDVVCSLRRPAGGRYDLEAYVDPRTSFVTDKQQDGRTVRVLERPGLWNGAMAGWNTAFVEVPAETFTPVKTLLDLLRPGHVPGDGSD